MKFLQRKEALEKYSRTSLKQERPQVSFFEDPFETNLNAVSTDVKFESA
jgi:hypothetical protein